jgi:hypothetical protein
MLFVVRYLSRYSDWLRVGWSGVMIRGGGGFSAPFQTGPGAQPAACTIFNWYFPGVASGLSLTLTPHPFLVPRSKNRVKLYHYSP